MLECCRVSIITMTKSQFVLLLLCLIHLCTGRDEEGNNFVQLYDCTCVGYTQSLECTVFGGGVTVWRGTAFNCQPGQDEIRLRHSQYTSTQTSGECNNGAIVARSVEVEADCYTSMLNVTIGEYMINQTVECAYNDLQGGTNTIIGHEVLRIVQESYVPLGEIHFKATEMNQLEFTWSTVNTTCPYAQYVINSSNCGVCPNTTVDTTVSCHNFNVSALANSTCMFAVQTGICGDLLDERTLAHLNVNFSKSGGESTTMALTTVETKSRDSEVRGVPTTVLIAAIVASSLVLTGIVFILLFTLVIGKRKIQSSSEVLVKPMATLPSDQNENTETVINTNDNVDGIYSLLQAPDDVQENYGTKTEGTVVYADVGECLDHRQHALECNASIAFSNWDKVEYTKVIQQPERNLRVTKVDSENVSMEVKNGQESDYLEQPPPLPSRPIT